jgi:hypothetical protein
MFKVQKMRLCQWVTYRRQSPLDLNSAQIARPGLQRSWQQNTIIFVPSSSDVSYFRLPAKDESHVRARRPQGTAISSPRCSSCVPQPNEKGLKTVRCNITVTVDIDWNRIAVLQKQDGRCAHTWSHFVPQTSIDCSSPRSCLFWCSSSVSSARCPRNFPLVLVCSLLWLTA